MTENTMKTSIKKPLIKTLLAASCASILAIAPQALAEYVPAAVNDHIPLERHMVRNRSPASTKIFVNKANSFGFSHSKAKGFNAVYGHFRLVLGNV
jgi:hypothetical protein